MTSHDEISDGRDVIDAPADRADSAARADSAGTVAGEATRPRTIAFYLPQFHPIPENDVVWGAGFTEWTYVARARPLFSGHHQPHLPADLGFYDLRLAEAREAQARLARRFGVDGFCYYHYWFQGQRLLNRPLDDMLAGGTPDFPFMLCWANEDWRSNWDGRSGEVLQQQVYSPDDDDAHIAFLLDVFRDPRYIRVDGKPVFLVYRAASLPDPRATAALWRARAREAGIGELLLCRVESGFGVEQGDPREIGFDVAVEFQPDWDRLPPPDRRLSPHQLFDYAAMAATAAARPAPPYPRFRCVTPRWDNTPRRPNGATIFTSSTPDRYRRWLAGAVRETPAHDLIFVNAWNEWGEGAHLEPETATGLAYLDAHSAAVHPCRVEGGDAVRAAILEHRRVLREMETDAERRLAVDDLEQALRLTAAAADWAWYNHTGLFVSQRLERVTQAAGRRLLATLPDWAPPGRERRRVLHVLTEAHAVGGHTRLAWRWMAHDSESEHSAVLTGQRDIPVPAALQAIAGERLHRLVAPTAAGRVVELATLMQQFDLVVLHIHPFDAVSVAACAEVAKRPPTLLLNHADHVFWLGVGAADAITYGRASGNMLTLERRGVACDRCVYVPTPLDPARRALPREEAKRQLGLEPDAVVLLTMGFPYKYAPAGTAVFTAMAARLLADHPRAHLVAVGPTSATTGWDALMAAVPGRVHALGYRTDTRVLLAAADVYLDSFPFTSPTSLLEASLLDTPVVAFADEPAAGPLASRDFVGASSTAVTIDEWLALAGRLIDDAAARREYGQAQGARVRAVHLAPGWNAVLAAAYGQVRHGAAALPADVSEVLTPLDDLVYLLHDRGQMLRQLPAVLQAHGLAAENARNAPSGAGAARAAVLSAVVLARDGVEQTLVCLHSLFEACAARGRIDITVVDHATSDATREMLAGLGDAVRVIRVDNPAVPEHQLWASGAAHAATDMVLLVTHHVQVDDASVRRLVEALTATGEPAGYLGAVDAPGPACLLYRCAHLTAKVWPPVRYLPMDEAA